MLIETNKILIIDETLALRNLLTRFFKYNNYEVESASNAKEGRDKFKLFKPNLVILDIHLPDENGLKLCQDFTLTGVMVMILTNLKDNKSILEGFQMGADDYLIKPFNIEILKARVEALLKRKRKTKTQEMEDQALILDKLVLNPVSGQVKINNQQVILTSLELKILYFLATHPNQIWHRSEILKKVWNDQSNNDFRKVDVHIGQIRKKIGDNKGELIKTIRGKGYRLDVA